MKVNKYVQFHVAYNTEVTSAEYMHHNRKLHISCYMYDKKCLSQTVTFA